MVSWRMVSGGRRKVWTACAACAALALSSAAGVGGENWPRFRGPDGTGVSDEKGLPLTWGGPDRANVVWEASLGDVDEGQSSPVVWGDRVFVTVSKGLAHQAVCYSARDGKELWRTPVGPPGPFQKDGYRGGSVAATTPATDGKRVYVLFGTAVLAALDCGDGKVAWSGPLDRHAFDVCLGSSPVLAGGWLVLLSGLTDGKSNITAYDPADGKVRWTTPLPKATYCHSTPAAVEVGGRRQLIAAVHQKDAAILGIDPADGKVLWSAAGDGETSSPAVGSGIVYVDSGRGGGGRAVALAQTGGGGSVEPLWALRMVPQELGSAVISREFVYRLGSGGRLVCLRTTDGSELYAKPLAGASRYASPVATADGRVYFASAGKSYVIEAGPEFKILATNDLGDPAHASPAVAAGRIYLKGRKGLYCIGSK